MVIRGGCGLDPDVSIAPFYARTNPGYFNPDYFGLESGLNTRSHTQLLSWFTS